MQLDEKGILYVWQHFTGLRIRDLVEVVQDRLSLGLDDGVDDRLDSPHGSVVTLLLPIVGWVTNLQREREVLH